MIIKHKDQPHFHGHRQRIRDKAQNGGLKNMVDYELLELLLTYLIPRKDVKLLAKNMLDMMGGLSSLLQADRDKIAKIPGMGETTALFFEVMRECQARSLLSEIQDQPILNSWDKVMEFCQIALAGKDIEEFHIFFLDQKNRLIKHACHSQGTINQTTAYPREIVRSCLEYGASALILVHNHPSGDPKPSKADIELTRNITKACATMNIVVHDHIIVGKKQVLSFKDQGLMLN